MAFSMQNDFVSLPYEEFPSVSLKSETKLKTFDSCTDARAWSFDNSKKAKYLSDILQKLRPDSTALTGGGDGLTCFEKEQLEGMSKEQLITHVLTLYEKLNSCNDTTEVPENQISNTEKPTEKCGTLKAEINSLAVERLPTTCCNFRDDSNQLKIANQRLHIEMDYPTSDNDVRLAGRLIFTRNYLLSQLKHVEEIECVFGKMKSRVKMVDRLLAENSKLCALINGCRKLKNKEQNNLPPVNEKLLEKRNDNSKDLFLQMKCAMLYCIIKKLSRQKQRLMMYIIVMSSRKPQITSHSQSKEDKINVAVLQNMHRIIKSQEQKCHILRCQLKSYKRIDHEINQLYDHLRNNSENQIDNVNHQDIQPEPSQPEPSEPPPPVVELITDSTPAKNIKKKKNIALHGLRSIIQEQHQLLKNLINKLIELQANLHQSNDEVIEMMRAYSQLQSQSLKKLNARGSMEDLEKILKSNDLNLKTLQSESEKLINQLDMLKEKLSLLEEKNVNHADVVNEDSSALDECQSKLQQAQAEIEALQNQLKILENMEMANNNDDKELSQNNIKIEVDNIEDQTPLVSTRNQITQTIPFNVDNRISRISDHCEASMKNLHLMYEKTIMEIKQKHIVEVEALHDQIICLKKEFKRINHVKNGGESSISNIISSLDTRIVSIVKKLLSSGFEPLLLNDLQYLSDYIQLIMQNRKENSDDNEEAALNKPVDLIAQEFGNVIYDSVQRIQKIKDLVKVKRHSKKSNTKRKCNKEAKQNHI